MRNKVYRFILATRVIKHSMRSERRESKYTKSIQFFSFATKNTVTPQHQRTEEDRPVLRDTQQKLQTVTKNRNGSQEDFSLPEPTKYSYYVRADSRGPLLNIAITSERTRGALY